VRGMVIGMVVGAAVAVGAVFALDVFSVWDNLGVTGSLVGGFILGMIFVNAGLWIGATIDESY